MDETIQFTPLQMLCEKPYCHNNRIICHSVMYLYYTYFALKWIKPHCLPETCVMSPRPTATAVG